MNFLKKTLGQLDLTAIVAVCLALATWYLPLLVGFLWIGVAVFAQSGAWDKIKTLAYVRLSQSGDKEMAQQLLKAGEKRY